VLCCQAGRGPCNHGDLTRADHSTGYWFSPSSALTGLARAIPRACNYRDSAKVAGSVTNIVTHHSFCGIPQKAQFGDFPALITAEVSPELV